MIFEVPLPRTAFFLMHARLTEADPGLATSMQRLQIQHFALADPILYMNPSEVQSTYTIAERSCLYRNISLGRYLILLLIST